MSGLVLLSGGLDSTTTLALAIQALGADQVQTLSVLYGQKHSREIQSAKQVSKYYGVPHHIVSLPDNFFMGGGSTLVDPGLEQPHKTYQELSEEFGVSPTYVPFRNGVLISIAAAQALILKAESVWVGTHAEDARNWAYPDCTPEFIGAMANALWVGTYHKVRLVSPLEWMTKPQVVKAGVSVDAPLYLSWTCYEGGEKACGECPSCVERLHAFEVNGYTDPIRYR